MIEHLEDIDYEKHVEFVSYTGNYPNLCSGDLTLRIDGKEVNFKSYMRFWYCEDREWVIDAREVPDDYKKYIFEIE